MSTQTQSQPEEAETSNTQMYYIIGAVVLVLVVAVGYAMRPKPATAPATVEQAAPTPTPGPITQLVCEKQYYNPVIGFPKYFLSAQGVDVKEATKIDCTVEIEVAGKVVKTETMEAAVSQAPERNGIIFVCTTSALELEKRIPTTMNVSIKNDLKQTSSCSAVFSLP